MVMRKNKMLGQGRGYYNYAPMRAYDRRVHSDSARGRRQPQQMPFMPINPALRKYSNVKLQEGTIKEHMEHPKLTMEQARMIALDHLKYNPRAYGKNKNAQLVNQIMDYESGQMNDKQTLKFFSEITKSGLVWQLQGSYGRTAMALVNEGFMDRQGNLSKKATDFIADYKGGKGGYLLDTQYDSRKSFYGKADVRQEGNKLILKSYNTDVAYIQDGRAVVKGTYSPTTLRHIKEFLRQNGFKADNAKQILKDYQPDIEPDVNGGKAYKAKIDINIDGKKYLGDVDVKLPEQNLLGGKKLLVHRKAYEREPYTRKGNIHVKGTYVPASTFKITDRGAEGRGRKVIPPLKVASLGVNFHESERSRRAKLKRLAHRIGEKKVVSKLIALEVLNKRTNPALARKAKADAHFIAGSFKGREKVEYPHGLRGGKRIRKGKNFFMGDRIAQGNWSDKRWAKARHKDNAQIGKNYEDWEKSKYQRWK